jgi:hypothetical protein
LRFQRILDAKGISAELKNLGAKDGDLIMIGIYIYKYIYFIYKHEIFLNNYALS